MILIKIASNPDDEFSASAEAEKVASDVILDANLTTEPDCLHSQSRYTGIVTTQYWLHPVIK